MILAAASAPLVEIDFTDEPFVVFAIIANQARLVLVTTPFRRQV